MWEIEGKTVLITGATSGIGRAGAVEIARRGAEIAVLGRNPAKLDALADEISDRAGTGIQTFTADLSDLDQVRRASGEILEQLPRIDVLVNNAGVAATEARATPTGHDEMLAANYLGPFLLTHLLLDRVIESAPARIVITGSEAHRMTGRFDAETFDELGDYRGVGAQLAYGRTKLLDVLLADELARRLDPGDISVTSFCPGLVGTELAREVPGSERLASLLSRTPLVRTPEQGARMMVRLVCDPDPGRGDGGFHTSTPGMGLLPRRGARRDASVARRVYERTGELLGIAPR